MSTPIRVLIVEDSEDNTALLMRELQNSDYDPTFEQAQELLEIGADEALVPEILWTYIVADKIIQKASESITDDIETLY